MSQELFGSGLSRYRDRHGYSVPWATLLKHMLNMGNEAPEPSTEASGSGGGSSR